MNLQLCDEQLGIGPCEICERERRLMGISDETKGYSGPDGPIFEPEDRVNIDDSGNTTYLVWEQKGLYVLVYALTGVCRVVHIAKVRHEA